MATPEQGPQRSDLSDLDLSALSDRLASGDVAQSMGEEIPLAELQSMLSASNERIADINFEAAKLADEKLHLEWKRNEIFRAIQFAQDKNPGAAQ